MAFKTCTTTKFILTHSIKQIVAMSTLNKESILQDVPKEMPYMEILITILLEMLDTNNKH